MLLKTLKKRRFAKKLLGEDDDNLLGKTLEYISDTWDKYVDTPYRSVKHWTKCMHAYGVYLIKNGGDYDWDFAYFYRIMKWKLQRMKKDITERDIIEGSKRVGKQIDYAIKLIDLLLTDAPQEKYSDLHTAKWGNRKMYFGSERPPKDGPYMPESTKGLIGMEVTYSKVFNKEDYYKAQSEALMGMQKGGEEYQDIKRRLFKHLETYCENWWD